jgi:hypothetical protein
MRIPSGSGARNQGSGARNQRNEKTARSSLEQRDIKLLNERDYV